MRILRKNAFKILSYFKSSSLKALRFKAVLIVGALSNLVAVWSLNSGEDITTSRLNYLSNKPNNFLGSFAGLFYASIPEIWVTWWQLLLIIQGLLVSFGLFLLLRSTAALASNKIFFFISIFCFITINLGMTLTRDGAMIAFSFFGFGVIKLGEGFPLARMLGFIPVVISLSFRPWLGLSVTPILFLFVGRGRTDKRLFASLVSVFIALVPVGIESLTTMTQGLSDAYPQQTVMLHDLASSYCLSTNQKTRDAAFSELKRNSAQEESLPQLCEFYKPSTWQNLIVPNPRDARISGLNAPIELIQQGDKEKYESLQRSWFKIIRDDPSTYVQNHLFFLSQVLVSGESQRLRIQEIAKSYTHGANFLEIFKTLSVAIQAPVEILVRLHILSPIVSIFVLLILSVRRGELFKSSMVKSTVISLALWLFITTIGFVSDNGRYTYLPVLLIWAAVIANATEKVTKE